MTQPVTSCAWTCLQEPIYLHVDPARLAQVFGNLLNNSCRYTKPGGTIQLSAKLLDNQVLVTVKDNGVGIPQDKLESIFDMFTQVYRAPEATQGGLGIGLTLVKRLVEMHGGSVEARSAGEDQGSEFLVRLPVLSEAPEARGCEVNRRGRTRCHSPHPDR